MDPSDEIGRRERFERTALPYLDQLYRVAARLSGRDEARDLVQETVLRAFRTFDSFRPGTDCKAWLLTILYSVFINRYRRRRREPELLPEAELESEFHRRISPGTPEQELRMLRQAAMEDRSPEVRGALDRLPESFRSAILLVDVEELSYEEAASVMGCPVGTLRSRLFRGRKALFVALSEYASRAGYLKPSRF